MAEGIAGSRDIVSSVMLSKVQCGDSQTFLEIYMVKNYNPKEEGSA